jgi:Flp pilus assembly protein TadB
MSRERALRRAAREAEAAAARERRARAVARRERRRALRRRFTPRLPSRRTGRLFVRRSRTQRAAIAVLALAAAFLVWQLVDSLALRVALLVVLVLGLPAFVVLALGRRT